MRTSKVWGVMASLMVAQLLMLGSSLPAAAQPAPPERPVVATNLGQVQGVIRHGVFEFRGIPFAQSVAGARRWALAEPAQPWSGVRQAQHFGPPCAQAARYNLTEASDAEDCLTLNISRPVSAAPLAGQNLPVLVWIHGGAFVGGSASLYRLDQLARELNAVVVTLNYRLGVFGFMPHPGFEAATNGGYALEDQRLGLRWIQQNIAAFGGDPGNITLAGESAGAASVCMHLLSPEHTQGLFHKAIVQSAACAFGLRHVTEWQAFGTRVAQAVGCTQTDPAEAVACLRQQDVQALIAAGDAQADGDLMAFAPVYGNTTLPRQTLDSLRTGQFVRVPVMLGGTRDELRLYVAYAVQAGQAITSDNLLEHLQATYGAHAEAVQAEYAEAIGAWGSAPAALGSLTTDFRPDIGINHCLSVETTRLLAAQVPVYFLEFADRGAPSLGVALPAAPDPGFELGAPHSSELTYYFPGFSNTSRMDAPDLRPESQRLAQQMRASWANFVRTAQPQVDGWPQWPAFADSGMGMRLQPHAAELFDAAAEYRCDFWRAQYPASWGGTSVSP